MIIGGEFEIDVNTSFDSSSRLPKDFNNGYLYSSGRAALFHILNFSKLSEKNKILLPDYLCDSIVEVVIRSSLPYEFYTVNHDLTVNIDSIQGLFDHNSSILIINYFGGIDVQAEIKKVKGVNPKGFIILDNVQALFSMFEPIDVDFMFTSFRKQLPVPDGAWVITKHENLYQCEERNTFAQYKFAGSLLKNFQNFDSVSDQSYLELFEKGEVAISNNLKARISDITLNLLSRINLESIRQKRLENSNFMIEELNKLGLTSILNFKKEMVPLFIPLSFKNRDSIRLELRKKNIYCPVHWPLTSTIETKNKRLYDSELSLVIDQRYNKTNLTKILTIIESCLYNEK